MTRINVYLPDELAEEAKCSGLNISRITQEGVRTALAGQRTDGWLKELADLPATGLTHEQGLDAVAGAKEELESA
ncbi:MAG: type II toxin-antitoxin system CcdA family antitoxin [Actinomycetota bacterium]